TVAIFTEELAARVDLALPTTELLRSTRRIQRRLARSQRANNPEKFDLDGRVRSTTRPWRHSAAWSRDRQRLSDLRRRAAATRKNRHGRLLNSILMLGHEIRIERHSF